METFNEVISGDQLVLVDFFATWCQPCKMMHPILEQLKSQLGHKIRVIKIDVDRNNTTAARFNIQSVPTLMLFRKGELLWRRSGVTQSSELLQIINSYLNPLYPNYMEKICPFNILITKKPISLCHLFRFRKRQKRLHKVL